MIKFNFELETVDAENLLACIRDAACKARELKLAAFSNNQPEHSECFDKHARYLDSLADTVALGSQQ